MGEGDPKPALECGGAGGVRGEGDESERWAGTFGTTGLPREEEEVYRGDWGGYDVGKHL